MRKNLVITVMLLFVLATPSVVYGTSLEESFLSPPNSARPGVYWYFMDGNLSREGMTADLESMKEVGLGNLVFLEVNVGVPRGPVDFMSDQWQDMFTHAVRESERLGIDITLGSGPGWTGSGGPWVKPEQAMQHLLSSVTEVKGPVKFDQVLPVPEQYPTPWGNMRTDFYEDVFVFAFPKCSAVISDVAEKALYDRYPYTSHKGVKEFLPAPANFDEPFAESVISPADIIDISKYLDSDGRLRWDVPAGDWTIVRMVRRATCASTRPAPKPGVGLECDKFDTAAMDHHFANYYGKLLKKVGPRKGKNGWTTVHIDSWEMGSQNWTKNFLAEFKKRRGYDAKPYLLAYSGRAVGSLEESERFLWDVRLTSQELVLENHAGHLKKLGAENGFELSIEPYDMNPTADLDLGAVADVPMCEFWSAGMGFNSEFSCIESTSIAHTMGRPIVSAEAFTAAGDEGWQQYPWLMKNQGDWAFCMGINRFVYHTFAHKPLGDEHRPGMTMGPYGVHWDRGQTWWPMVSDYHKYVTRCSNLLRQGVTVSDILYLTPEGAPHIFRPPPSALASSEMSGWHDKKGYGFDGCSPNILMDRAKVKDGCITFDGGTSYRLLILPRFETMTPELLEKIIKLVKAGAVVYGAPPVASPSLTGYPKCDDKVNELAAKLWGKNLSAQRKFGKGRIILDSAAAQIINGNETEPLLPDSGSWIWFNKGNAARSAAAGGVYFQYTFEVPQGKSLSSAKIEATADNSVTLKVNGREVLSGDNFNVVYSADILPALHKGKNTISVVANNAAGDAVNPAGFIAVIRLSYTDGTIEVIGSDQTWRASIDGVNWSASKKLGPGSMAPWMLKASTSTCTTNLYPEYAATAALLEKMGVPEDFQSDGPVRYGHRRTDAEDIYFIANTTNKKVEATCTFRTNKGKPQLWDPVTAEIRTLPKFSHNAKTTSVPFVFEPHQSFFVIFPRKGSPNRLTTASSVNFHLATPVTTLEGAWEVSFDPKWGGPEKVTFDKLVDWTKHAERGIKYYSGIATYKKSFDASGAPRQRVYLDLGMVNDIARVKLNGKDLGVVWCAPWRVDITDVVKTAGNVLEIDVANRWPNRLLGDKQAEDKDVRTVKWDSGFLGGKEYKTGRYTFTTGRGPDKLLPSGLIGPVQIMAESN